MSAKDDSLGKQLIADFEARLISLLKRDAGMPEQSAREAAIKLIDDIQQEWGGVPLYFAKGHLNRLSRRDQDIYTRFSGSNFLELARQYRLTERQIRIIVAKGRLLERQRRQTDLFEAQQPQ
ncbi:Mor transcription activator family protein [Chitinimonas sp.]|uniref:Mor transcription activator family protein n=1 Tax=Chitinimonas sp. TaxID=1934313 RepID=UPI0035B2C2BE